VGDGFKFGCGFTLAVAVVTVAALPVLVLGLYLGHLAGLDLPALLRR
jgi:hypothetical protein